MPFKKGDKKIEGSGNKAGNKQAKTLEWEQFGRELLEVGMPRVLKIMEGDDDKQFLDTFTNILEYFKPKLSRVENKQDGPITINMTAMPDKDLDAMSE